MPTLLRHVLTGLAVLLIQWLVIGRLRIWGVYADAVLILLTLQALRYGRLVGAVSGFALGFGMDLIYGTWGIQMFIKTLVGFLVGLFPLGDRGSLYVKPRQAFVGLLVIGLLHNGLAVVFHALQSGTRNSFMIFGLWLGSAVYTAVLAAVATFFQSKR